MSAPGYRDTEPSVPGGVGVGQRSLSSVFVAAAPVLDWIILPPNPQVEVLAPSGTAFADTDFK